MPSSTDAELQRVSAELGLCRQELAQARQEYEEISELLFRQRRKTKTLRRRLQQLSTAVAEHLNRSTPPTGVRGVAGQLARGRVRRMATSEEWVRVQELAASELFDEAWYLQQHPRSVESGMPPALHYLRIGAAEGFDPGPRFSVSTYLADHPDVAASGENPLLHHLRHGEAQPPSAM